VKKVKWVAATILLASLVLFLLQNLNTTEVKFLVWKAELSVAIPILVAFFIGGVGARPMIRFLNGQRRERKRDRKAAKAAAKKAAKAATVPDAKATAAAEQTTEQTREAAQPTSTLSPQNPTEPPASRQGH